MRTCIACLETGRVDRSIGIRKRRHAVTTTPTRRRRIRPRRRAARCHLHPHVPRSRRRRSSTPAAPSTSVATAVVDSVLFTDDLVDDRHMWGEVDDPEYGTAKFVDGDYVWEFRGSNAHWLPGVLIDQYDAGDLRIPDAAVTADLTIHSGGGVAGVFCREAVDTDAEFQWYEFVVRDGYAAIRLSDSEGNIEPLAETRERQRRYRPTDLDHRHVSRQRGRAGRTFPRARWRGHGRDRGRRPVAGRWTAGDAGMDLPNARADGHHVASIRDRRARGALTAPQQAPTLKRRCRTDAEGIEKCTGFWDAAPRSRFGSLRRVRVRGRPRRHFWDTTSKHRSPHDTSPVSSVVRRGYLCHGCRVRPSRSPHNLWVVGSIATRPTTSCVQPTRACIDHAGISSAS